jgi:uncharacterized protein (DUF4415 family)
MRLHDDVKDAVITAAAMGDSDCPPMTDGDLEDFARNCFKFRDRFVDPRSPLCNSNNVLIPVSESVDAFRATGEGWEARVQRVLDDWLRTHSPMDA